jgi:TusA-related sulfurtransferase
MKGGDMVTKKVWLSLLVIFMFVCFSGLVAYACGNNPNCGGKDHCPPMMKDAKVEVTNLDNGITVQITSDNPDVAKAIQEHKDNCKCEGLKDVKFKSKKVDNGIILTITSKDPETVKQIQEQQANCMKNCQNQSSTACPGKTSGKCPGMMTGCPKSRTK